MWFRATARPSTACIAPVKALTSFQFVTGSFPATMLSAAPASDDESDIDDHITLKAAVRKRRAVVESDSD